MSLRSRRRLPPPARSTQVFNLFGVISTNSPSGTTDYKEATSDLNEVKQAPNQDTRQGGEAERRPRRRHSLTSASLDADVDLADKAAGGSIECGSLEGEFTMTQRAADHGRSGPSGAPVNILRRPLERRAHGRARSQEAEAPQRCISNGAGLHHSDFTGPSNWRRP